jgi:hypothetical protein
MCSVGEGSIIYTLPFNPGEGNPGKNGQGVWAVPREKGISFEETEFNLLFPK